MLMYEIHLLELQIEIHVNVYDRHSFVNAT